MKALVIAMVSMLCVGPAFADDEPIYLTCTGFRFELNGPVKRQIAIYASRAQIDGHQYRRIPNETYFVFLGPEPSNNVEVQISRLDGSYFFDHVPSTGQALEMSRADHGEGCKKVEKLF